MPLLLLAGLSGLTLLRRSSAEFSQTIQKREGSLSKPLTAGVASVKHHRIRSAASSASPEEFSGPDEVGH